LSLCVVRADSAVEDRVQRVVRVELGAGERRQRLGLRRRQLRGPRSPGGELDRPAHHPRHEHKHDEPEQLLAAGDLERVPRLDEEEVDEQRGCHRGGQRDQQPADERDRDDGEQVQQQLPLERQRVIRRADPERQQRQAGERERRAGEPALAPERPRRGPRGWTGLLEQVAVLHVADSRADAHRPSSQGTLVTVTEGS
jgi:hypothetical protein